MKSDNKLGRLVQCRCSHTCLPNSNHGFQWILPRTKSKHMLYEQIQQKNKKASTATTTTTEDELEASFSLFTHNDLPKSRILKRRQKRTFKMPILMETELERKVTHSTKEIVLKEFFVKTSYN